MGRRTNYGFEKRQRELKKQKKKEAKAERKRLKKEQEAGLSADGQPVDGAEDAAEALAEEVERDQES